MKIAAIDIGSNAIRLQITKILSYEELITFKKLEYIRFPLRLGHDVFRTGQISDFNVVRFKKLMTAYKSMIDLYEIDHYYACATSAMRESSNGAQVLKEVADDLGLQIEIISGEKEAELINEVIGPNLDEKTYIHIDVGGGSTEINFYVEKRKVLSKSFKIGGVRRIDKLDKSETWDEMRAWVKDQVKDHRRKITAIGTGGNINKVIELAMVGKRKTITIDTVRKVKAFLANMSLDDRLNKLQLNPDRADVIVPATEIYIGIMEAAGAQSILVPNVGLKDGINYHLFQQYYPTKGKVLVKN